MSSGFFYNKVARPVIDLMRQGITPEKIAISISLGIALGVFPVLGSTTLLCALAAVLFKLNLPAIQIVNYLVYPLQIILLVPFIRLGGWFFGGASADLSLSGLLGMVRADTWRAILTLSAATFHAIAAWLLVATPFVLVLNQITIRLLRKVEFSVFLPKSGAGDP